jgi:hypothetical protein
MVQPKTAYYLRLAVELVLLACVAGFAYTQLRPMPPCTEPISYRIGTIDSRFGVTDEALKGYLEEGVNVWNAGVGKQLFTYSDTGKVTVNLVYDDRQKTAELGKQIESTQVATESVRAQFEALQQQYRDAKEEYDRELEAVQSVSDAYNARVEYWNARGGAPAEEYAKLSKQKEELATMRRELSQLAARVNTLADQTNKLASTYNNLASLTNKKVDAYNSSEYVGEEFNEAEYTNDGNGDERIDIYQFDGKTDLVRVAAHEFGHALGLGHVEGKQSIMYSQNTGTNMNLSAQDLDALRALCGNAL